MRALANHFVLLFTVLLFGCSADREAATPPQTEGDPVLQSVAFLASESSPNDHIVIRPGTIAWQPAPPSLEAGAQVSILEGDPSEPGIFTMRIKMPDGFAIAPHTHPEVERVTVVSGTFLLGEGATLDRASAGRYEPGSYLSMPVGMRHYAIAEGETVIQLTSNGPWQIEYVKAEDDPRLR